MSTFLTFCILFLWNKSLFPVHMRRGEGSNRYFWEVEVSIYIIWNFSEKKICLFSHILVFSTIYLYQCGHIDIYFMLWVIIQHYFIYFVAQIISALAMGSFSFDSCILLTYLNLFFFKGLLHFMALQDDLDLSCIFCVPILVSHFSKGPWFLWEWR